MRGIPDNQVSNGEFSPTPQFASDLADYFGSLNGTHYRGQTVTPSTAIFSITTGGLVTFTVANPYAVGAIITIKNAVTVGGDRRGGKYVVASVGPMQSQLTLVAWDWGATDGGTASQPVYAMQAVASSNTTAVRITTHKVGRPFDSYRGRKSKVRRPA